jgi:hypothetical protein
MSGILIIDSSQKGLKISIMFNHLNSLVLQAKMINRGPVKFVPWLDQNQNHPFASSAGYHP